MTQTLPMAGASAQMNLAGLSKNDYRGNPSTLCQGCGHNSIASQIIAALYEMNVVPEEYRQVQRHRLFQQIAHLLFESLVRIQWSAWTYAIRGNRRVIRRSSSERHRRFR